jgi:DNA/RNA endonuclease YhcR with UshA esterase domain
MRVAATGASSALVFLNSAEDRNNPDNFTVVLDKKAQDGLRQQGVMDIRKHYDGKSIQVVGTLSLFRAQPQIIVSDPARIKMGAK